MKKVQWTFDSEAENKKKHPVDVSIAKRRMKKVQWTFDSEAENKLTPMKFAEGCEHK